MIGIGSDHAGYALKEAVKTYLKNLGQEVDDVGTSSPDSVDYPDYAVKVARGVSTQQYEKGILICGSGIGMTIVADKIPGVRAALCMTPYMAESARQHNNANILTMGARIISETDAKHIVKTFLETTFSEETRHQRRIDRIHDLTEK